MPDSANLIAFLGRVRRRYISTELARQLVTALAGGLAGLVVLLLLGTQVMDWQWPLLLFGGTFAWGLWRLIRAVPANYRMAQVVDRRLGLHDALSTAYHFVSANGPVVEAQRAQANELATRLSATEAVPMHWPKTVYATAALLLTAATLIAVRYGVLHTLDLQAPVSEAIVDVFRPGPDKKLQAKQKRQPWMEEQLRQIGLTPEDEANDEQRKFDGVQQGEISTPQIPDVNDLSDAPSSEPAKGGQEGQSTTPGESEQGEGNQPGQNADPSDQAGDRDPESQGQQAPPGDKAQQKQGSNSNSQPGENSSLLDKMRDAFANMMNKMKIPNQGQGEQQAQNQKGASEQASGGQQKGAQQKGQKQSSDGDQQADAESQGDQMSETGERSLNAKGQGSDSSSQQNAPPDAKAGVGKADGDKAIREAEQQAAMGKISEIFGKRAQSIQGEVMVEVSGGKQQLRTQYSNSSARHEALAGDISRDEVPLHHQHYVQQYFEQIRKQAPKAKGASQ